MLSLIMRKRNAFILILFTGMMSITQAAEETPITLPLWPNGIPNASVQDNREQMTVREDGDHHFSHVTQPLVDVFLAQTDTPAPA